MIQRIQTIWLFLSGIVLLGLFIFPLANTIDIVGLGKQIFVSGIYTSVNNESVKQESFILLTIATVVLALLPIFIIFQFKQRKRQIQLIFGQMALIAGFTLWLYLHVGSILSANNQFLKADNIGIGFFLLPVSIIFLSMAIGGIRKDEKLIKSADRLR